MMKQTPSAERQSGARRIKPWHAIGITFGGGFLLFLLVHVFIQADLVTFLQTTSPLSEN